MDGVAYFAYGSNMLRERLAARCSGVSFIGRATLPGFRATFDKPSKDGSGKGAFEPADCHDLAGVLWHVPEAELPALDRHEGVGSGYERWRAPVLRESGQRIEALTYRATELRPGLRPYDWYLALVLAGAVQQGLPLEYIRELRATPFNVDTDLRRLGRCAAMRALHEANMLEVYESFSRREQDDEPKTVA